MLNWLIGSLKLDFVTLVSIEEAARRLKAQEQFGRLGSHQIRVKLTPQDTDCVRFTFKRWGGVDSPVEAHGTLERSGANATHVTAQVNLAWHMYAAFGIFALVIIWFVIRTIAENPLSTTASTALWIFGYWLIRQQRHEVARHIQTILSPTHW